MHANPSKNPGGNWRRLGRGDGQRPLVLAAVVTPFRGGDMDLSGFEENLRFQDAAGLDGLLVAGTTGERECLEPAERDALVSLTREVVDPSLVIIAGTRADAETVGLTAADGVRLAELGADAMLVPPPLPPEAPRDDDAIVDYFAGVCAASPLPVIAYHPPSFKSRPLSTTLIHRIRDLEGLSGVKDSLGSDEVLRHWLERRDDGFAVLVGNAPLFAAVASEVTGGILALASVMPDRFVALAAAVGRGESTATLIEELREAFEEFGVGGLAALKEMHEEAGLFGGGMRRGCN